MSKVNSYVAEFEAFNQTLEALIESCSDEQWQTIVPEEERPVAVMCHHIVAGYPFATGWAQELIAKKELPPVTMEQVHQINADHADNYSQVTQADVLRVLRENVPLAVQQVRRFRDEDLAISAPFAMMGGQEISVEQILQYLLLGHGQGHLAAVQKALGIS